MNVEAEPKKIIKKEKVKIDPENTVDTKHGAEVMDQVVSESEPIIPRELNREQIADLRASILKAQESENDATIDWYGGNFDTASAKQAKAETEKKQIEKIKKELQEQKTGLEHDSMMSWYEGDYVNAKKDQVTSEKIGNIVEGKDNLDEYKDVKKEALVEKYGTDMIAHVRTLYVQERKRLVAMGYKGAVLEASLNRFKKNKLEPLLRNTENENKQVVEKKDSVSPKPKKNFWDKIKSSWFK
jgi:hypothetical protein